MRNIAVLLLVAFALSACAPGRYGNDEESYRHCVKLAQEEGRLIKYIENTLRYRRKHRPSEEVEEEIAQAKAERRAVHRERRRQGCI